MSAADAEIHDLLVQQVLGESLSAEDQARLTAALAADPALRTERVELEKTLLQLAQGVQAPPPPRLRGRILSSVAQRRPAARAPRWPYALAASVTLLAVGVGTFFLLENQQLRRDMARQSAAARMLLEPNVVLSFALQGENQASRAAGVVLLDLDAKRASVSITDLPVLPDGQAYFLWAELEGTQVPCGQFRTLADGTILTQFPIPVDSYVTPIQRLILTVETGSDATAPSGPVVMIST